jgi:hypothetical protein
VFDNRVLRKAIRPKTKEVSAHLLPCSTSTVGSDTYMFSTVLTTAQHFSYHQPNFPSYGFNIRFNNIRFNNILKPSPMSYTRYISFRSLPKSSPIRATK